MYWRIGVFALFSLLAWSARGQVQPLLKGGLAALPVRPLNGATQGLADLLEEALLERVAHSGWFTSVLGGSDLRASFDLDQAKAALNCDADSCLTELGGALGVPFLLASSVGRLGSTYVVSLRLIQVEEGRVLGRASARVAVEGELLERADKVIDTLFSRAFGSPRPIPPSSASSALQSVKSPPVAPPNPASPPRWGIKGWTGSGGLLAAALIAWVGTADYRAKDADYRACLNRRPLCPRLEINRLDTDQKAAWSESSGARAAALALAGLGAALIVYDLVEDG